MSLYSIIEEHFSKSSRDNYIPAVEAFKSRWITLGLTTYWFSFWLLNGFDKFLARKSIGLFTWYGNNRIEKFSMYFDRLNLDLSMVKPTLAFLGIWELALALPFIMAIDAMFIRKKDAPDETYRALVAGIFASIVIFCCFSIFDVLTGDRAELWEHGTYIVLLISTYIAMQMERMFADVTKDLN